MTLPLLAGWWSSQAIELGLAGAERGAGMKPLRSIRFGAFILLVCGSALAGVAPPPGAPVLSTAERAAIRAYYLELRRAAGTSSIVDVEDPALQHRLQRGSGRHMSQPEIPAELRRQHAHGRVIVASVTERDGTVSHAKVVVASAFPAYDAIALRAVAETRFEQPVKLDGEPVRAYSYTVIDFKVS